MGERVDIVVLYVDDQDKEWKDSYNYWKDYEIRNGIVSSDSKQAFGVERIRNWNFLKYWFRGVEKNCEWVNKIYFVVQDSRQVPEWLNTENEKIRVVYHKEFIPSELLPTFNAYTIELYLNRIEDLSDSYVFCNDDFFFINRVEKERFFKNGVAQHENNLVEYGKFYDYDEFLHVMNNNLDFETRYMGNDKRKYYFYHLPSAHKKNLEKEIMNENYEYILNCLKGSKFRYKTNISADIYVNILKIKKECDLVEKGLVYGNSAYVAVKNGVDFNQYRDKDMVCFNDTDLANENFESVRDSLNEFLESVFPEKSEYER